uniref:Ion transport domain-containing protein n=1 Tax=Meloidogyne incognita TaxID=6306 RepID=A0A914LXQ2_MELIC
MSFEKKRNNNNSPLSDLLKHSKLTLSEQLSWTILWNRADIARSEIFTGQLLPKSILHNAMMESLIHNRVEFVRLLLENGVNMDEFLTIARLEELYNTDQGPPNTLYYIVRDVVRIRAGYRYKLPHIGMAVEKLMANGFRSHYTSSHFRQKYNEYRSKLKEYQRLHSISEHQKDLNHCSPPPTYPRCGSEFFARASARGLPTSASDTRLSGKINHQQVNQLPSIPKNKNQNVLDTRTNQNIGSPPTTDRSTNKATLNYTQIPAVCGSRTLSSHILWRSACRRDNVSHLPTAPQQVANSSKQQPFNRTNQQFTGFPDGNNSFDADEFLDVRDETHTRDFRYPFSDLLIWAVLTKRHDMAICMWQHGQEALAKALVTCRLYKSLAKEAAEDYLELEVCEELKKCAEEFRQLSLDLLDHCYKEDDAQTLQLLTYELAYWGRETCLSLAVLVNNKQFLAHPCCQILLADLWHGGLRIRSNSNLKVILGIIFPPSIFLLEFKSREELMLQPQTAAEHQEDINDSSSSSSDSSVSSPSSSPSESENEDVDSDYDLSEKTGGASLGDRRRRVSSRGSMQSLNFTSIFQSKRRSKRSSHINASNSLNTQDLELGRVPNQDEPSIGRSRSNARELRRPKTKTRAERQRRINASNAATVGGQTIIETGGGDTSPSDYSLSNQISKPSLPLKSSLKLPTTVTPLHIDVNAYHHPQFLLGNDDIVTSGKEEEKDSNSIQRNSTSTISDEVVKLSVDKEQDIPSPDQNPSDRPFIHQTKSFPFNNRWKFVKNIGAGIATNDKPKTMEHPNSRLTISGGHVPKGIPLPEGVTLNKKRQIKFRRKVYEFFVAPITTFWAWMLSFVVFLSTLTYVLLIRTPLKPTFLEWYLLAYVVGFGIETVRKFAMSEPKKFSEKVQYFFGNYWNFLTTVAILGFVVGFIFRLNPSTSRSVGRIILAVDSVLWTIKLLDFLGVFPRFGPYITMAGKMIMNMSSIVVMLGISLLGFGLARQSITYPNEDWHWLLLRNVFYKPYFMLYGEVYADEIDTCGDEAWDEHLDKNISISTAWTHRDNRDKELACVPGHWIPPILMTVFLLIANILLISMLIAIFNNIFDSTIKISQQIWLFQRYRQVMEYEATPFLPPPFTPIYHIYMIYKYLNYRNGSFCICFAFLTRQLNNRKFFKRRKDALEEEPKEEKLEEKQQQTNKNDEINNKIPPLAKNAFEQRQNLQERARNYNKQEQFALFDFSLKLFLTDEQVEKIHEFEAECMENLAREKELARNRSNEERLNRTCERTEAILRRMDDLVSRETIQRNVNTLENKVEIIQNTQVN